MCPKTVKMHNLEDTNLKRKTPKKILKKGFFTHLSKMAWYCCWNSAIDWEGQMTVWAKKKASRQNSSSSSSFRLRDIQRVLKKKPKDQP